MLILLVWVRSELQYRSKWYRVGKRKPSRNTGKSKLSERELERRLQLALKVLDVVRDLGKLFFLTVMVFCVAYFAIYLPVKASHGETTTITFVLDWLARLRLNILLAWGTTFGCFVWARAERAKRLRERQERDTRITELETKLDPNRTSSRLTTDGNQTREPE